MDSLATEADPCQPLRDLFPKKIETAHFKATFLMDQSLGVIQSKKTEIRAFGPQNSALTFGVNGHGMDGWMQITADPEVWLEFKPSQKEDHLQLNFKFIGLQPKSPLSLAFYVKAGSCQIDQEIFKPKSLRRYRGAALPIIFENEWALQALQSHQVELIPLAGEGHFWDCEFLLSFDLHPLISQFSFLLIKK